jgi:hypothetical protein
LNGRITQEGRARLSAPNIPSNRSPNRFYWERDFPISIQDEQPDAVTRFVLEFDPSLAERRRLQSLIGSAVQGSITFELKCGVSEWHLVVRDAAATSNILPKHIRSMCRIVSQAISPQYIPSVRTAESAQEIVRSIVRRELAALESKKEYRAAMKAISAIQKPVLAPFRSQC